MQKPHWTAPLSRNACWSGLSAPSAARPSTVRISRAVGLDREHQAGVDGPAVDDDGAGAALADEAALLGAGQLEVVAQDVEQRVVRGHLERARGAR